MVLNNVMDVCQDERARRAVRIFLLVRELSLELASEAETQLPLTDYSSSVKVDNVLDLSEWLVTTPWRNISRIVFTCKNWKLKFGLVFAAP